MSTTERATERATDVTATGIGATVKDAPGERATNGPGEGAALRVHDRGADRVVFLSGAWTMRHLTAVEAELAALPAINGRTVLDMSGVTRLDTAGAWLIERFGERTGERAEVAVANVTADQASLMEAVRLYRPMQPEAPRPRVPFARRTLHAIGAGAAALWTDIVFGMNVLGASLVGEKSGKGGKRKFGITPIVAQIDKMGVQAIPVVSLMSFLIGAIVAQQGAFQLRSVAGAGNEIFAVDLVAILLLREIGVMLTAIMVAGRTGSAITAELGSMRMREEVDALKVIGLNPISTLVFPRLVALIVALTVLTIIACFAALIGGALVLYLYADLSLALQLAQFAGAIDATTLWAGILKAPVMAIIIAVVASLEGMQVEGSAESLGRRVTASVVKSIFLVIFIDGVFAIFYSAIDF